MNRRQPLMQWACFSCRKVFKRPKFNASAQVVCPECGAAMTLMGTAFRAPRKTDLAQWRKAEILVRHGFPFRRNSGPDVQRLNDVPTFLEFQRQRRRSTGQVLLERIEAGPLKPLRTLPPLQGRVKQINAAGKPEFMLSGHQLKPYSRIQVLVDGRWCPAIFRFRVREDQIVEPYAQLQAGLEDIVLTANTVCRLE